MRTLSLRDSPIPTLYVKSAPGTYYIRAVFEFARYMSPCLLVLEDVETIVTPATRSYFFNEIDGLENNNGILTVASTNFLEQLDPGLSKRPSRFDRKYLFPLPNLHERELYAEYWREKLKKRKDKVKVIFLKKLCPAMAQITDKFSFAYMQEAYVSSLLNIARQDNDDTEHLAHRMRVVGFTDIDDDDHGHQNLDQYLLWRVFKQQVEILRDNMDTECEAFDGSQLPHPSQNQAPTASAIFTPLESSTVDSPGGAYPNSEISEPMFLDGRNNLDREWQAQQFLHRWDKYPQRNSAATEYNGLNYGLTWMKH